MPAAVEIVDVTPRDGLQNLPDIVSTEHKLELIQRLVDAGLRRIEVASFVNPKRVPQMGDVDELVARLPQGRDISYIGLVLNQRGFDRLASTSLQEANCVILASETFNQRNQGCSVTETLSQLGAIVREAQNTEVNMSVTIGAAFGCPFEGDIPVARVLEVTERLVDLGLTEITLADTIGCGVPSQVTDLVTAINAKQPSVELRCHFHNTRNTANANIYAALQSGVRSFDASTGGIGGCPFAPQATGNVATEDVLYMVQRMGLTTSIDATLIMDTAHWIEEALNIKMAGMVSRAGWFPAG